MPFEYHIERVCERGYLYHCALGSFRFIRSLEARPAEVLASCATKSSAEQFFASLPSCAVS